jgi:taurine dioxygenase
MQVDPGTGQQSLYVNRLYTRSIVGLRREESQMLLQYLFAQTNVPELQLRVQWEEGTLVIWDNEKTQHYAVRDTDGDRLMHRVMVNTGR